MTISDRPRVLAVDDEEFNLDILNEYLEEAGYHVTLARDGLEAMSRLEADPQIEVVILDRMMPRMSGMEVLRRMKAHPRLRQVPVIMQTAAASREQIQEGIDGGVFYYLTKPYEEAMLLSLVAAALAEGRQKAALIAEVHGQARVLGLMTTAEFRFRTLEDAAALAVLVSNCFPDPERVVYGLSEILINAVEHGNLGISYADKTALVATDRWADEVRRRLALPEQQDRFASLAFTKNATRVEVVVCDCGPGFDFETYLELSAARATDPHGRGIATARMMSFDSVVYTAPGNRVTCVVVV